MKEKILPDLFLGLLLFVIWLNIVNGNLEQIRDKLPTQVKFIIYSILIILIPFFGDLALNSNSSSNSTTFFASLVTVIIALVVRESVAWYSEQYRIKDELFTELYNNYQSLENFQETYNNLKRMGESGAPIFFGRQWNNSLISKWKNYVYQNYRGKIRIRKLYNEKVIEELEDVHERMETALLQIQENNDTFNDPEFMANIFLIKISSHTKRVLLAMNERKAKNLFDKC